MVLGPIFVSQWLPPRCGMFSSTKAHHRRRLSARHRVPSSTEGAWKRKVWGGHLGHFLATGTCISAECRSNAVFSMVDQQSPLASSDWFRTLLPSQMPAHTCAQQGSYMKPSRSRCVIGSFDWLMRWFSACNGDSKTARG